MIKSLIWAIIFIFLRVFLGKFALFSGILPVLNVIIIALIALFLVLLVVKIVKK